MSSTKITVRDFIHFLKQIPEDAYVLLPARQGDQDEGIYDGPSLSQIRLIDVNDMRSGMNPTWIIGDHMDAGWKGLVIGADEGEEIELFLEAVKDDTLGKRDVRRYADMLTRIADRMEKSK